MKTEKIVIEVIWRPTEKMRNASMLAANLTDVVAGWMEDEDIDGAVFASPVTR